MATKPILLTVDDDPEVLRAIERDLRRKYGKDYRVLRADAGVTALDVLRQVAGRHEPVALFLVDQRMPQMSGVEFLEQARSVFPDAKRMLLTAYADTDAAIKAINTVKVDYYSLKPWDPPEENLYPVLDDLLDDWQANYRPPFEGIRVVGHRWSADSHAVKDFLGRNGVPYQWLDVESTGDESRALLQEAGLDDARLPVVFLSDGTHLVEPTLTELAAKIGRRTSAERPFYDLVIVGGGPAGLAAAVYGASEGLDTMLVEREAPGGQAALYFARYARHVVMLVRGGGLAASMSQYLIEEIAEQPTITVRAHSQVVEACGDASLERLVIADSATGERETVPARALFIFIGALPRTDWLDGAVQRDAQGFLLSGPDLKRDDKGRIPGWTLDRDPFLLETSVPGVFVAGDVRHRSIKRVASGVGEGSIAVSFIHQYLSKL